MKIKTKLLLAIGGSLVSLLAISFDVLLLLTSNAITEKLNDQLTNQVDNVTAQVSDLVTTSAKSYLTAVGEKSNGVADRYFELFESGEISYKNAYDQSLKSIIDFNFLQSGIVFVTDNKGVIIAHEDRSKIGTIAPMQAWIQRLEPEHKSFKTYEYQTKNRLTFRVFNNNYGYNICVDVNTSEFINAMDLDELNKAMNRITIGLTGFPFLLTKDGYVVTNREKNRVGRFILNEIDINGSNIYQRVLENQRGSFQYQILDKSGEIVDKFLTYNRDNNSELIICLTGSVSEFYDTVDNIKRSVYILGFIVLIVLSVLLFIVSSTITIPIISFTKNLNDVVNGNGDLTKRIILKSSDEIGIMVSLFNNFLDTIQTIIIEIQKTAKTSLNIKNYITYRVNETSTSVKKILVNIVSIKNQTKQLDQKVEKSVEATKNIKNNISNLNSSIKKQGVIMVTTTSEVIQMISSFNEIEDLVGISRDNVLRITSRIQDKFVLGILEEIIETNEKIKFKTNILHTGSQDILKNINQLKDASSVVTDMGVDIKKEANEVTYKMDESKEIASYVLESMDVIINSAKKISNSMEQLQLNTIQLEDSGDNLQNSINRFKI